MNDVLRSGKFEELRLPDGLGLEDDGFAAYTDEAGEEDVISSFHANSGRGWSWAKLWPLALSLAGVCIGYAVHPLLQFQPAHANLSASASPAPASLPAKNSSAIMVDVKGDVLHPGVYQLNADARVKDAVQAAGGFRHAADATQINLAAPVDDGTEVDVPGPTQGGASAADGPTTAAGPASKAATTAKLDINQADAASLQTIPGIGPAKAAAIITYRKQHGPFTQMSDLVQVPGIGPATLSRIQPYLSVGS